MKIEMTRIREVNGRRLENRIAFDVPMTGASTFGSQNEINDLMVMLREWHRALENLSETDVSEAERPKYGWPSKDCEG